MTKRKQTFCRREFLKEAAQATTAVAVSASLASTAAPDETRVVQAESIPIRTLGRTDLKLPILGYGGAGLPKKWGNPLSLEDRVKLVRHAYDSGVRYFDTSISYSYSESQEIIGKALKEVRDEAFVTTKVDFWDRSKPNGRITKVDKKAVARQVEKNLAELQSDYVDAILIHGTPGVEQMTVEQCMEVQGELAKARDKGLVRFVGFSAHGYFDKALALIETGGFDLCMLACGYLPRGHSQRFTEKSIALREKCLEAAHQRQMGIVAMKVMGAGMLGARSGYVVPAFDKQRLKQLPGAAIRHVLQDQRIHMLTIGMRLRSDIAANLNVLTGQAATTAVDRALLADFSAKLYETPAFKRLRIE